MTTDIGISHPRLLGDFTPATGAIKGEYEDFVVEELPLYEAGGVGTHTYFLVEKRGLSTMNAVADIARVLEVPRREIGYAGLKDARAVTRQWMSVEHIEPERLAQLELARVRILDVTRHTNKLRLGHLRGNAFRIRVRDTEPQRLAELQDALAQLGKLGVPNYFGHQRFGGRGDSWKVGREIVRGDLPAALDVVLGRPGERDRASIRHARELYDAGQYAQAVTHWPGMFRDERRALRTLAQNKGRKKRAFLVIDKNLRRFYVSAFQSQLFNEVVARRMKTGVHQLVRGDLAWRHANGAVFEVLDASVEQPRADELEISPSGPLFGYRMTQPSGSAAEVEDAVLAEAELKASDFRAPNLRIKGARRPVRFPVRGASIRLGADDAGVYLELGFELPRGSYATSLLRELFVEHVRADESEPSQGAEAEVD